MTVKNAAFLALAGTLVLTILVLVDFVQTLSGVLADVIPVLAILRSLVYLFASITVTVFFFVFQKSQAR